MKAFIRFVLVILCLFANASYALDRTGTGFYYPIGTTSFDSKCGTWLGRDTANGGCYFDGLYHVGVDMMTGSTDADVYAIADGKVIYVDAGADSWGTGNCALFIQHKKQGGNDFIAVYGHLACSTIPSLNSDVLAGHSIGKTGRYDIGGIHLHFAIHDGPWDNMAKSGWGRMSNSKWPSTNTLTDPIAFIRNNSPFNSGPSLRLCAQISANRKVCWDTKNSVDKRCESGSDWTILDNQTKWRYPTTKAICSSTGCYRTSSVLDFFVRPAYAAAIDGCASQQTGTGYGGSGPYPTPPDPEEYGPPSSSDLPKLVTAGTSSSAPNLEASVVIEKSNKDEDSNDYVRVGDLYCGVRAKNTTSVSIGSFKNKCILYDGKKAGNDPPVTLDSKTVDGLTGGDKETTHHAFTIRDPGYYTLYGCVNTGSSPPKETKTSDNCGTKTFQAYSIPDVYVQKLSLQGGVEFLPGSTVTVVADFGNTGDDFHAGKNRRMTVTAELSGCVSSRMMDTTDIDEDVLRHGDNSRTKTFSFALPLAATGICTATVIADPEGELLQTPNKEANRGNNRMSITFSVKEPEPVVPPSSDTRVTGVSLSNGTNHVFSDERVSVSVAVSNFGNAPSAAMGGRVFSTPIGGGTDTTIGTFSLGSVPAGGNAIGTIPDILFVGNGTLALTACLGNPGQCFDGGTVTVEARNGGGTGTDPVKRVSPAALFIINGGAK